MIEKVCYFSRIAYNFLFHHKGTIIGVILAIAAVLLLFAPTRIIGDSMYPALHDGAARRADPNQ